MTKVKVKRSERKRFIRSQFVQRLMRRKLKQGRKHQQKRRLNAMENFGMERKDAMENFVAS